MKELKKMKETLVTAVQGQLGNLAQANTHELGCAIDMIKDLSEAIYYCEIVDSMKEAAEEKEEMMKMMKYSGGGQQQQQQQSPQAMMYFHERVREPYYDPMRDMDWDRGRMYYNGGSGYQGGRSAGSKGSDNNNGSARTYTEPTYMHEQDGKEGKSGQRRRMYMESKMMNSDKGTHVKELDAYAQELMNDVLEMIHEASPEEKQLLKKKIAELSQKIV